MTEQVVTFETAKLAKKKGFDWECREIYSPDGDYRTLNYYEGDGTGWVKNSYITEVLIEDFDINCTAPTQSLLQKYLRDVHKILIIIDFDEDNKYVSKVYLNLCNKELKFYTIHSSGIPYEQALEAALIHALNLIP